MNPNSGGPPDPFDDTNGADGLDPRLSAFLDGELDPLEEHDVRQLLETSAEARAEYGAVRDARDMVRDLPLLEPPPDVAALFDAVERSASVSPLVGPARTRRARARAVALSVVATAAFWGVVVSSSITAAVTPSLDGAIAAHTLAPSLGGDDAAMDDVAMDDVDMPVEAPGSMRMVHVQRRGRNTHAIYSDGERQISVFEEPGHVRWDELPPGEPIDLNGSRGWHGSVDGYEVFVVQRGRRVYTIVAQAQADEMKMMGDLSDAMPEDDTSLLDRVRDASYDVVTVFGLRG